MLEHYQFSDLWLKQWSVFSYLRNFLDLRKNPWFSLSEMVWWCNLFETHHQLFEIRHQIFCWKHITKYFVGNTSPNILLETHRQILCLKHIAKYFVRNILPNILFETHHEIFCLKHITKYFVRYTSLHILKKRMCRENFVVINFILNWFKVVSGLRNFDNIAISMKNVAKIKKVVVSRWD